MNHQQKDSLIRFIEDNEDAPSFYYGTMDNNGVAKMTFVASAMQLAFLRHVMGRAIDHLATSGPTPVPTPTPAGGKPHLAQV